RRPIAESWLGLRAAASGQRTTRWHRARIGMPPATGFLPTPSAPLPLIQTIPPEQRSTSEPVSRTGRAILRRGLVSSNRQTPATAGQSCPAVLPSQPAVPLAPSRLIRPTPTTSLSAQRLRGTVLR